MPRHEHSAAVPDPRITDYLDLARGLARQFARRGSEPFDDLYQVASHALVKAARTYDQSVGPFLPYARRSILGALMHYLRDCGWGVRPPRRVQDLTLIIRPTIEILEQRLGRRPSECEVAAETGISPDEVRAALVAMSAWRNDSLEDSEEAVEPCLAVSDDGYAMIELWELLDGLKLSEAERRLLTLRAEDTMTHKELGEHLGRSQTQLRRDLRRLQTRLHAAIEGVPAAS